MQITSVRAVFTDAPPLSARPVLACGQLLVWIAVHPSAWRNEIERINAAARRTLSEREDARASEGPGKPRRLNLPLPADFALIDLRSVHWEVPELRRLVLLLVAALVGLCLSTTLLAGLAMLQVVGPSRALVFGMVAGGCYALSLSGWMLVAGAAAPAIVSAAVAAPLLVVLGTLAFAGFDPTTLTSPICHPTPAPTVSGFHPFNCFFGAAFGLPVTATSAFATAIAASVTLRLRPDKPDRLLNRARRPRRWFTFFCVCFAYCLAVGAFAFASWIADALFGRGPSRWDVRYGLTFGIVGAIIISLSFLAVTWVRARNWEVARVVLVAALLTAFVPSLLGSLDFDATNGVPTSGPLYFGSIGIAAGMPVAALFAVAYVITARFAGVVFGSIAGAVSGAGVFLATLGVNDLLPFSPVGVGYSFPLDETLALAGLAILGVLFGLTRGYWQSIVLWPLESAVNFGLLFADSRATANGRLSAGYATNLRFNSAFWDEDQYLPMVALKDHLSLVQRRLPGEAEVAEAYLDQKPQGRVKRVGL